MKKVNKTISHATEFKKWFAKNKTKEYYSSRYPYYDVLYELLIIQNGLCAYTELRLVSEENLETLKNGFEKGKYSIDFKPQIPAQIEHFSKENKKISGWNFENLFAVFGSLNLDKNKLEDKFGIDNILKPDSEDYLPEKYLLYDKDLHLFFPNSKLDFETQNRIKNMIIVLGLNNDFIKMKRSDYLKEIKLKENYFEIKQSINQFFTAYEMM